MSDSDYLPIIFVTIFISGYIVALFMLSFLGGWFHLNRKYSLSNGCVETAKILRWRSLNLNYFAAYRRIVHYKISENGLIVEPSFLLLFFHKPLFFSWDNITDVRFKKNIFSSMVFKIGSCRLAIWGVVAENSFRYYQRARNTQKKN